MDAASRYDRGEVMDNLPKRDRQDTTKDADDKCGLDPDGKCLRAGSDHCEWECRKQKPQRVEAVKRWK